MRMIVRVAAMVAGLIFCLPLHYLWKIAGARSIWPQVFLAYAAYCAGLRVRIEGTPLHGGVLFAANHVSWLDVLVLGGATPAVFVARHDVEEWPLVGWIAGLNDTIFVARQARHTVQDQADELRNAFARARAVALFPEGTTDGGHELLPFRPSLFASLFPPLDGVTVQPVAIDYGALAEEIAWVGEETMLANARRMLSRRQPIPAVLRFLEPIDPAAAGNRKLLAARSQAAVEAALFGSGAASAAGSDPL